jgi:hypothetical protein
VDGRGPGHLLDDGAVLCIGLMTLGWSLLKGLGDGLLLAPVSHEFASPAAASRSVRHARRSDGFTRLVICQRCGQVFLCADCDEASAVVTTIASSRRDAIRFARRAPVSPCGGTEHDASVRESDTQLAETLPCD